MALRPMSRITRATDLMVSSYVYVVAIMLVLFMIGSLITGINSFFENFWDVTKSGPGFDNSAARLALEQGLLHTIAFTIVLVKAYKILISYAATRHINLKFLVEIAIVGPTIELIFNADGYNLYVNVLFAFFALANLLIYLHFYKTLKQVSKDYEKEASH